MQNNSWKFLVLNPCLLHSSSMLIFFFSFYFLFRNIIHGSDGPETAKDEIALWFKPNELVSYTSNAEKWIYGVN